jgi:hypothetical protein
VLDRHPNHAQGETMTPKQMTGCILLLFTAALATFGLPYWVLKGEFLTVMTAAAVYGFSAFRIRLPRWCICQEFRGVTMVALGAVAMWIPSQYLISAWLVGTGAKLVMGGFTESTPATVIRQAPGDIVLRPSGQVVTRD